MAQIPKPVNFQVRPANGGLNTGEPPQSIDKTQSPGMMNVRFKNGQITFRDGYKIKYTGMREPALWIDTVYVAGATTTVAFSKSNAYQTFSGEMPYIPFYKTSDGSTISTPVFNIQPAFDVITVDVGNGQYDFTTANNGDLYPEVGSSRRSEIMVYCNQTSDGIYAIAYTGAINGQPVEGEKIDTAGAPSLARSLVIFAGRVFACGTDENKSEIRWSAISRFDQWDTGTYPSAGSLVLGDSPDWVQKALKLGEYLIVYKERSIYIGRETYMSDPAIRFEPAPGQGVGLAAPNSVGELGREHVFLGWDDVYVFSLQRIQPIGTRIKGELFYGEDGILPAYLATCTGIIAEEFDEYWLFIPSGKWPSDSETEEGVITNLLSNPNFENDLTDWGGSGSVTASNAVLGTQAIKLTPVTDSLNLYNSHDENASITDWEFSLAVLLYAPNDAKVRLSIEERDSTDTFIQDAVESSDIVINGYQREIISGTIASSSTEIVRANIEAVAPADADTEAYYALDGNATDSSANSHNGTWSGTEQYVEGVYGQAAYFDGSSQIDFGVVKDLYADSGTSWTLSLRSDVDSGTIFDNGNVVIERPFEELLHVTVQGGYSPVFIGYNISGFMMITLTWDGTDLVGYINDNQLYREEEVTLEDNTLDVIEDDDGYAIEGNFEHWRFA